MRILARYLTVLLIASTAWAGRRIVEADSDYGIQLSRTANPPTVLNGALAADQFTNNTNVPKDSSQNTTYNLGALTTYTYTVQVQASFTFMVQGNILTYGVLVCKNINSGQNNGDSACTPAGLTAAVNAESGQPDVAAPPNCGWIITQGQATPNTPCTSVTFSIPSNCAALVLFVRTNTGDPVPTLTLTVPPAPPSITPTSGFRFVPVTPCRIADTRNPAGPFGGPSLSGNVSRAFNIPGAGCSIPASATAYSFNVTVVPLTGLGFISIWPTGEQQPGVSTLNSQDGRVKANAAIVPAGTNGSVTVLASNATHVIIDINGYFISDPNATALAFYPMPPCRILDTRSFTTTFGSSLASNAPVEFPLLSGPCQIPGNAKAYALNFTVVPAGQPLGFLSAWPSALPQPGSSTLNDPTGTTTANAAIVPAGANGDITVLSTDPTNLVIDINGYFAAPGAPGALAFYSLVPCRIIDTRNANGPLGGPALVAQQSRNIPVLTSPCGAPGAAQAYSLNATVVPPAALGFIQLWNTGGPQPGVSTLNDSDVTVVANAAIIPVGTAGEVTVFASNVTHFILDINGSFAP